MKKQNFKFIAVVLTLLMVVFSIPVGVSAETVNGINVQFGDPAYPTTWPESNMSLEGTGDVRNAVYSPQESGYYPEILSLYAQGEDIEVRGTGVTMLTYDAQGTPTEHATITHAINGSNLYTVKIGNNGGFVEVYSESNFKLKINFAIPNSPAATGGSTPNVVNGYLPVGQFARDNAYGWGQIMSNNTNAPRNVTPKFINGFTNPGVSLGMLGGYTQFRFDNAINNNPQNKYGIDFIVYGNAFVGNPEAGNVMVYGKNDATQTYGWYNLAGSRYYMGGSKMSTDISYIKILNPITIGGKTFDHAGIYTSDNYVPPAENDEGLVNAAISAAEWSTTPITTVTEWWPDEVEGYTNVWKLNNDKMDNIHWNKAGQVEVITYQGLAQVQDDEEILGAGASSAARTNCYRWGYADVRANGNLGYGVAINPYESNPADVAGGDGFDLSWAVDSQGDPVSVSDVHYVRVYTGVLFNAGIFGETSTEVCGIYTASQTGDGAASSDFYVVNNSYGEEIETINGGVQTIGPATITIYSNATNVYINGEKIADADAGHSIDLEPGRIVQIITQNGTESPYITVLKCE